MAYPFDPKVIGKWQRAPWGDIRKFRKNGSSYDISKIRWGSRSPTWSLMYNGPRGAYTRLSPIDGFKTLKLAKAKALSHGRR